MFPSDARALPIVYDVPVCTAVEGISLLDCPRESGFGRVMSGGALGSVNLQSNALAFVVGVSCESEFQRHIMAMSQLSLSHFRTALFKSCPNQSLTKQELIHIVFPQLWQTVVYHKHEWIHNFLW